MIFNRKSNFKSALHFLLIFAVISLSACSSNDDAQPDEDSKWKTSPIATATIEIEGENKIEFKSFSEKEFHDTWLGHEIPAYTEDGALLLQFYAMLDSEDEPAGGITILISNYQGGGDYNIEGDNLEEDSVAIYRKVATSESYLNIFTSGIFELENGETAEGSGLVTITAVKNGRISGNFELLTHNMEGRSAHIKNGKFDVKLISK